MATATLLVPMEGISLPSWPCPRTTPGTGVWESGMYEIDRTSPVYMALVAKGANDVSLKLPALDVPDGGLNIQGNVWAAKRYELKDPAWFSMLLRAGAKLVEE